MEFTVDPGPNELSSLCRSPGTVGGSWLGFEGNFSIFNVYFTTSPIKNALSFQGALSYCCLTNTQNLEISPPFMCCSVFFEAPDLEEGIIDVDDTQTDTLEVQFLGRYGTGRENPTAKKISPNTSQGWWKIVIYRDIYFHTFCQWKWLVSMMKLENARGCFLRNVESVPKRSKKSVLSFEGKQRTLVNTGAPLPFLDTKGLTQLKISTSDQTALFQTFSNIFFVLTILIPVLTA